MDIKLIMITVLFINFFFISPKIGKNEVIMIEIIAGLAEGWQWAEVTGRGNTGSF